MTAHGRTVRSVRPRIALEDLPDAPARSQEEGRALEEIRRRRASRRSRLTRRSLLASDAAGLTLAFFVAEALFGWHIGSSEQSGRLGELPVFLLVLPLWLLLAQAYGLYRRDHEQIGHTTAEELVDLFHLVTVGICMFWAAMWLTQAAAPRYSMLFGFWALAILLVGTVRVVARAICRRRARYVQNAVVIGAGRVGHLVAQKLHNHPEYGIRCIGVVDADPIAAVHLDDALQVLGPQSELLQIVAAYDVDRVVLAFSNEAVEYDLDVVHTLRDAGVQIDVVPRLFEMAGSSACVHYVEGLPLVGLCPLPTSAYRVRKRAADLVMASVALVMLMPLLVLLALLVLVDANGPVLFRSERIGKNGERFRLLKFRTMRADAEHQLTRLIEEDPEARAEFEQTHKLRDDPRVTRLGKWLRRTSLDELPQLLNVVRGELSVVGPRPITVREYHLVASQRPEAGWSQVTGYWQFPELRPGITGLWQVNGRSTMSYDERVRLDKFYVANSSFALDLAIIAKTLRVLGSTSGAY